MAKYLVRANYTAEGLKGLMKDGGSGRRAAVEKAMASVGGSVDAFYFAFGDTDAFLIVDFPDTVSATALALTAAAAGSVTLSTTPLITADEVDAAIKKTVAYSKPGG